MRVVVVGATGNVGTSLVRALSAERAVDEVVGVARRAPELELPRVAWRTADIASDDLRPVVRGADAVVHLAWLIQPSRDLDTLRRTNLEGTSRLLRAIAAERVPALVYASSVGTYARGPKDRRVDESWSTRGIPTSFYSRHKAEAERRLDAFEGEVPSTRVVRLRPGLIFKRGAASGVRRLFAGPFLPTPLLRRGFGLVPDVPGLRVQAVHTDDVAEAYRLALLHEDARGPYNLAAEPVLEPRLVAERLGWLRVPVSVRVARAAARLTWRLHLQPSPVGWVDLGLGVPLMDCDRAARELGWSPRIRADDALAELVAGIREGAGEATPRLSPETGGPLRAGEVASGVGSREGA
ncbi:MAG TPA: NAD-dependent epimerase/dehydratase family protein [Gaiellaceae bacterium]|nr:NAD-dependent epimerase/dehydratase family protein [Gaiellaceae bacterium]